MASSWDVKPLGDLVEDIFDRRGVTPLKLGSDFTSYGHRVVSAKSVRNRAIDVTADDPRYIDDVTYAKWMKTPLRQDDVVLTSEAPLGEPAYLASDVDWALGQRLFGIRTDKTRLHGRYLYYALQVDPIRADLMSRATGTTVTGVRQSELRKVGIPLPPLPERNWSRGGGVPGLLAGEAVERVEHGDAVPGGCGGVGADGGEVSRAFHGAHASGYLLSYLGHPDLPLGRVVVETYGEVGGEA